MHRFSEASTSSSFSGLSTAGEAGPSASYLAPPSTGRLRKRSSETTIEPLSGRGEDTSPDSQDEQSESEGRRRARRGETVKNYVCTYCNKDFGGKSDWKRHETTFHEPQYIWQCPICNRSFNSKRKFSTHHGRDHNCDGCNHAIEAQKALPGKTAFGCGFQGCNQLLYSWDERCNHVARHFEDGEGKQNWHYSTMIKNLLRQAPLDRPWKELLTELHGRRDGWPELTWRQEDTRAYREALEYGNFGNPSDLLQGLWQASQNSASSSQGLSGIGSPTPLTAAGPVMVDMYSDREGMASQSQLHGLGVATGTSTPGHNVLGADMYSDMPSEMQYFSPHTMTPGSEVVPATAYGMQSDPHGQMYQQLPYVGQPGYEGAYQVEHPQQYPPVAPGSVLSSDAYYAQRPYSVTPRPSLPPHTQAPPPGRTDSPRHRHTARVSHSMRERHTRDSNSRRTSVSYGSPFGLLESVENDTDYLIETGDEQDTEMQATFF